MISLFGLENRTKNKYIYLSLFIINKQLRYYELEWHNCGFFSLLGPQFWEKKTELKLSLGCGISIIFYYSPLRHCYQYSKSNPGVANLFIYADWSIFKELTHMPKCKLYVFSIHPQKWSDNIQYLNWVINISTLHYFKEEKIRSIPIWHIYNSFKF